MGWEQTAVIADVPGVLDGDWIDYGVRSGYGYRWQPHLDWAVLRRHGYAKEDILTRSREVFERLLGVVIRGFGYRPSKSLVSEAADISYSRITHWKVKFGHAAGKQVVILLVAGFNADVRERTEMPFGAPELHRKRLRTQAQGELAESLSTSIGRRQSAEMPAASLPADEPGSPMAARDATPDRCVPKCFGDPSCDGSPTDDEIALAAMCDASTGMRLPSRRQMRRMGQDWLIDEGIRPNAEILGAERCGASGGKQDVRITLAKSKALRISMKRPNADMVANWVSQGQYIEDFGAASYQEACIEATKFANHYAPRDNRPFVGVSIGIGVRSGQTCVPFVDVCPDAERRVKALRGSGKGRANCLYVGYGAPDTVDELVRRLLPLTLETFEPLFGTLSLVFRPVYPPEASGMSKQAYARFVPYAKPETPQIVRTHAELMQLGHFVPVPEGQPISHREIVRNLEQQNILLVSE